MRDRSFSIELQVYDVRRNRLTLASLCVAQASFASPNPTQTLMHHALARLKGLVAITPSAERTHAVRKHVVATRGIPECIERRQSGRVVRKGIHVVSWRESIGVAQRKERHFETD